MLAAFKLRAVPININFRYVEAELTYLLDNADCTVVVYDPEFSTRLEASPPTTAEARARRADRRHMGYGTARAQCRRATSTRDRPTTTTCSTRVARPACRRVSCGVRKTCSWRSGRASTRSRATRWSPTPSSAAKAAADPFPIVSFMLPPLMHGAVPMGNARHDVPRQHRRAHAEVRRRRGVATVEREGCQRDHDHGRRDGSSAHRGARGGGDAGTSSRCSR